MSIEEAKGDDSSMLMPRNKKQKKKLAKKKRSKSWDEETAKQEQQKRQKIESRRNSLASRKDVVNKTLLRSIKRHISEKFEDQTGFETLRPEDQKAKFLQLVDSFTRTYFPEISQVSQGEDDPNEENVLSRDGIRFIVG